MKKLSIIHKFFLILNYFFALLLLIAFISPYFRAGFIPLVSLESLIFPFLVLINILFVLYWLVQIRKYFLISLLVLLLNYYNIQALYQWKAKYPVEKGLSLMSYNVRLFNSYKWIKQKGIDVDISNYLKDQNPDILLLQEFLIDPNTDFSQYKYKYVALKGKKRKAGLVIFSKYKIINKGSLNFADTYNNTIWADIVVRKDTFRVYNLHLQSYQIVEPEKLVEQDKLKVTNKLQKVFNKQYKQAKKTIEHSKSSKYPVIFAGDFNNTAFSSTYHILKKGKTDAFVEAGEGFGITWRYKLLPLRIDFILPDANKFQVTGFETFNHISFSDHYPIKAYLKLKKNTDNH